MEYSRGGHLTAHETFKFFKEHTASEIHSCYYSPTSFGVTLRSNPKADFSLANTIVAPTMEFFSITMRLREDEYLTDITPVQGSSAFLLYVPISCMQPRR